MRSTLVNRLFVPFAIMALASMLVLPSSMASSLVSVEFNEAKPGDVLAVFSKATGLTVAVAMGVELEGTITLTLEEISWEVALTALLQQVDLVWERSGEYIIVKKLELGAGPSNTALKLTVRPVTAVASATSAPGRPAA